MATMIKEPYKCTFIHIPKTGGNSITRWLLDNNQTAKVTKRRQHANIADVCKGDHSLGVKTREDLGWTFCVVRNPWDYCASWYQFKVMLAESYINFLENNPTEIKNHKKKFNLEYQKSELKRLQQGFDWWIMQTKVDKQSHWAADCDYVMKLENLVVDFSEVQCKLKCHIPLPYLNRTVNKKKSYRDYYTKQEQIDRVAERYKIDIETYGYDF